MATATLPPAATEAPGCVTLYGISWDFYERFLEETRDQRVRHFYDEGVLTIMSPLGLPHEWNKKLIGQMIEALTEELGIPRRSVGALTLKSSPALKGAEPDESYYIAHEPQMRGRRRFDPTRDPPPDLLVEVDITSPSLDRLPIFAALGVPEVWVYDGSELRPYVLRKNGSYRKSKTSRAFPFLPFAEFAAWLRKAEAMDETSWIRAFRAWVREQFEDLRRSTEKSQ
ncbi:MAG: Uma2 family endonuclease [Planctomycetales bacterium]